MRRFREFVVIVLVLGVAAGFVSGCATIMKGSKAKIGITSSPAAAHVVIKTLAGGAVMFEGTTPATASIAKNHEYVCTVSLEGYKDQAVNITQGGIEGWFWGNLLCGGIIGIVVDLTNGAMHKLEPENINVTLATAYLPNGEETLYAVFRALDSHGELRSYAVPFVRDHSPRVAAAIER